MSAIKFIERFYLE